MSNAYIFHNENSSVSFEGRAEDESQAREKLRAATLAAHRSGLSFIDEDWILSVVVKPTDEVIFHDE